MDESTYVKGVLLKECKRKYTDEKNKLIDQLYNVKTEDENEKLKNKLLLLDSNYKEQIEQINMLSSEPEETNTIREKRSTVDYTMGTYKAENDNDFFEFVSNLFIAINEYKKKENNLEVEKICLNIENSKNESLHSINVIDKPKKHKIHKFNKDHSANELQYINNNDISSNQLEDLYNINEINFNSPDLFKEINLRLNQFYMDLKDKAHCLTNLYVPKYLWSILFDYQKTSIIWLDKLYHSQQGGILADEMGLGKTLQIIAFIASLLISSKIRNVLIVSPSTVINQWVLEFKKFFPYVRVCVLHKSYISNIDKLKYSINKFHGVVIVSYDGCKNEKRFLKSINFDYIILDEGHKIKNKNSGISLDINDIPCINRIVLTGTPIQNNLSELWALINYTNPGLLGSSSDFIEEFEDPIKKGGYASATKENIEKAYKTAVVLKSIIDPYILRRLKVNVAGELPKKSEKILFCELTEKQEQLYKYELDTDCIYKILMGKVNCMVGFVSLKKIINHPYLIRQEQKYLDENKLINASGKMIKLDKLLQTWKKEKKKVLIFTQMIGMLDILERYCAYKEYKCITMNGKTALKTRIENINRFNVDDTIFIFLLTTRVGGLGLNLVAASRIIIYDPDWNPSNDAQAKERAWRYGQKDDVETYRFVTVNTLEEKIYKRQIFKTHLSTKILKNPKCNKLIEKDDLTDLFSYCKESRNKDKIDEVEFEEEKEVYDVLKEQVDDKIVKKMEFFRNKKMLNDDEMIQFIRLREGYKN
ncbi:DNA excision repair protein ERCC-6 [Conglomerata obtusa]